MKPLKIVIPILLAAIVGLGWMSTLGANVSAAIAHANLLAAANQSYEDRLYQQSIIQYKQAFADDPNVEIYQRIREVYVDYYAEEHNSSVRGAYLNDMTDAYQRFPQYTEFWETALDLYLENDDLTSAFTLVKSALGMGVQSEKINDQYVRMRIMTTTDGEYYGFKTAMNGYLALYDGERWSRTDGGTYTTMGVVGDDGSVLCMTDYGLRLIDAEGITRARFDLEITDAGLIDEETGLVAVQIDGKSWSYLNIDTHELLGGNYETAGTFGGGYAAVKQDGTWHLIDATGAPVSDPVEDIKLDPHGRYLQSDTGIAIVRRDGTYRFCDATLNPIGDFTCSDIDAYYGAPIAFERDGQWGFVTIDGTVVCEPTYNGARSFVNGCAAISDGIHHWGFVDEGFTQVVRCQYFDAFYFVGNGVALVSDMDGVYEFMTYQYS